MKRFCKQGKQRFSAGAAIAIGIGVGAALAASLGPAGWAAAMVVAIIPWVLGRRLGTDKR